MSRDTTRKCGNCKNRCFHSWSGIECCMWYEMTDSVKNEIETAKLCEKYEYGTLPCLKRDDYTPSATRGDYSPSCPWNAPGMSISDFI